MPQELSAEEREALEAFAMKHGRHWKSKLSNAWFNGSDAREWNGHLLRRIRNNLGPAWLAKFPADVRRWN